MQDIIAWLQTNGESSITAIADGVGIDRHVASKRLSLLEERGAVTHRDHGPSTLWSVTDSALVERFKRDDQLTAELKHVFEELPATVTVHDQHNEVVWSTSEGRGHKRRCHLFHRGRQRQCEGCPVDDVKASGETKQFTTEWHDGEQRTITLIPVTDNDETTSIIEHIA